jgi:pimeloyl-ACP methyl ester carboxylesterase
MLRLRWMAAIILPIPKNVDSLIDGAMMLFLRSLIVWLAVLEAYARRRRWYGLTWLAGVPTAVLAGVVALALIGVRWKPLAARLALTGLPALLLQAGLASVRNWHLNPLLRLNPGTHPDRMIERVDIPMPTGSMPALYLVPHGAVVGAVVILHGSGCDKTYYAWRLADTFVSRGIAALLVDLDGHGESPRIQRFPNMLENATEGVAWLRERHARVGLVGVSLGGCLAARAVADGLVVDGLALLETPPYLQYTSEHMILEARALSAPFLRGLFGESTAYHLAATIVDLVGVQSEPRIRCEIGTVDLIAALDLVGSLPMITAPLLLIYAGRDAIVRKDQAALVWRMAPAHAELDLIAEASHLSLTLHPRALERLGEWMHHMLAG